MKFLFTVVLVLFTIPLLTAQHIAVKSFRIFENDLDARVNFPMKDQNGDVCALIKVMTTETGFDWNGDLLGIRKTLQKKGEIWIYVPFGAKRITISHTTLGVLRNYAYPLNIEKATVYEMVLSTEIKTTLKVSSEPPGANVYIGNELKGITTLALNKMLPGAYQLSLMKTGFETVSKNIEVQEGKDKEIDIRLTRSMTGGDIYMTSNPIDASIYINDELKGATPLTLHKMPAGAYRLSLMKTGFKTVSKNIKVQDGKTTE